MAKKRGRKKKAQEIQRRELPGGFWHQIGAVLMIAISVILVAAWFGQGGVALNVAQDFLLKTIGYTTFLLPFILIYLAVMIFRADDNRLDPSVWIASFLMILWFSGIFGISSHGLTEAHGGFVGTFLNNFMLKMVAGGIAYFVYVILILITALFMYAETPAALFRRIGAIFKTSKNDEDVDNAKVMRRSAKKDLLSDDEAEARPGKVNVVNHAEDAEKEDKKHGLLTKVTNKAEEAKEDESQALTVVNTQDWKMPSIDLLARHTNKADPGDPQKVAEIIRETFGEFGIDVTVGDAIVGPSVTQYRVTPPAGVKISRITSMSEELTSALGVGGSGVVRIAPVPNERRIIGVEVPNIKAATVGLREIMTTSNWRNLAANKQMAFALGRDNDGNTVVLDLADMPHLLVAGTTGSGKSVTIHSMLISLMYHNSPADLRLILIDPKHLEFGLYDDIPHLLTPVVEDVKSTLSVLKWAIDQMEYRLKEMRDYGVQNIADYNSKLAAEQNASPSNDSGENSESETNKRQKFPYIIIAFDELQDFIKAKPGGREIETMLARLAAKARAAGIILVIATQYPKADIITTAIKANIPSRIVMKVVEQTQSRVALDRPGAEKLIGNGDLLYMTRKMPAPRRAQSAFVSNGEIEKVVKFLRSQGEPQYVKEILTQQVQVSGAGASMGGFDGGAGSGSNDDHRQAAEIAVQYQKISTTLLQRKMHIGFGRAASIIDDLEDMGIVSPPPGGNKAREVLISSMDEYDERNPQ